MSTSLSGSLPLLSTLFVFYYTDFMENKICMYVCIFHKDRATKWEHYSIVMSFCLSVRLSVTRKTDGGQLQRTQVRRTMAS